MKTTSKKWFIISILGKEECYFIIQLFPAWSGVFRYISEHLEYISGRTMYFPYIYNSSFDTREEAIKFIEERKHI